MLSDIASWPDRPISGNIACLEYLDSSWARSTFFFSICILPITATDAVDDSDASGDDDDDDDGAVDDSDDGEDEEFILRNLLTLSMSDQM